MKKLFLSLAMLALTVGLHAAPATEGDVFVVPTAKSIKYGKGVANITCQAEVTTSDSSLDYAAGHYILCRDLLKRCRMPPAPQQTSHSGVYQYQETLL